MVASDHAFALYATGVAGVLVWMEAMEEVGVEEEQGEVEQEVAAVVEEEEGAEVEVGELREGRRQRLVIPVDRPGWSVQEGTAARAF